MQDKHTFSIKLAKGGTGCNKKFFFPSRPFKCSFDKALFKVAKKGPGEGKKQNNNNKVPWEEASCEFSWRRSYRSERVQTRSEGRMITFIC